MGKPPAGVKLTMEACCIMFSVKPEMEKNPDGAVPCPGFFSIFESRHHDAARPRASRRRARVRWRRPSRRRDRTTPPAKIGLRRPRRRSRREIDRRFTGMGKIPNYFKSAQKELLSLGGKLIDKMKEYDKDNIPAKIIDKIEAYIEMEAFTLRYDGGAFPSLIRLVRPRPPRAGASPERPPRLVPRCACGSAPCTSTTKYQ